MIVHRRNALIEGLSTLTWLSAASPRCIAQELFAKRSYGCVSDATVLGELSGGGDVVRKLSGNEPIIPNSGNPVFDRALAETLLMLVKTFNVLPGFGYFQEPDHEVPNAMALPKVRMKNPDGTVLFGLRLLKKLLDLPEHPEVAVVAVCAHEWGHILQYKRGLEDRLLKNSTTVKPLELHADFLAGYFAGVRRKQKPDYPAATIALTQYGFGDPFTYKVEHHGTKQERGDAVREGFLTAYRDSKSLDAAIETGINFARSKM